MQVEVSKHTEGAKDKMMRPNGLPESLIRYDGIAPVLFLFYITLSFFLIVRKKQYMQSFFLIISLSS